MLSNFGCDSYCYRFESCKASCFASLGLVVQGGNIFPEICYAKRFRCICLVCVTDSKAVLENMTYKMCFYNGGLLEPINELLFTSVMSKHDT